MISKVTMPQIDTVVLAFATWLAENSTDVAAELSQELCDTQPIVPVEATTADLKAGVVILAVFTARAAMRKAIKWFEDSKDMKPKEQIDYLLTTMQDLLAAVSNCDRALYHLNAPAGPGLAEYLTDPEAPKGGAS